MRTIGEWIKLNHRRYPTREAIVDGTSRLTFAELAESAWSLGRGLRDAGSRRGPRGGAGRQLGLNAEVFFGVAAAGGTYVAYNWRWARRGTCSGHQGDRGAEILLVEDRLVPERTTRPWKSWAAPSRSCRGWSARVRRSTPCAPAPVRWRTSRPWTARSASSTRAAARARPRAWSFPTGQPPPTPSTRCTTAGWAPAPRNAA